MLWVVFCFCFLVVLCEFFYGQLIKSSRFLFSQKEHYIKKKSHPVSFLRLQGGGGDFFFGGNISFR